MTTPSTTTGFKENSGETGKETVPSIPLAIFSNHMQDLRTEIRSLSALSDGSKYNGESHLDWLREVEKCRIRLKADDEHMRALCCDKLTGPAGDYVQRLIETDRNMTGIQNIVGGICMFTKED